MNKKIFVDLEDLKLEGNVLDISLKGNTIVPKLINLKNLNNEVIQKDYIKWASGVIPSENSEFDTAIAMFSFGKILSRYKITKIIKEVSRVLKQNGKMIIWDVDSRGLAPFCSIDIKAVMPDRKVVTMRGNSYLNKLSPDYAKIIKILEHNNFRIKMHKINESVYSIEAENIKNENSSTK